MITLIGLTGASGMVFVIYGAWKGVAGPRGDAQPFARQTVRAICRDWNVAEFRARASAYENRKLTNSNLKAFLQNNNARLGPLKGIHWSIASAPLLSREAGTTIEVTLDCRFAKVDHQRVHILCNEQATKWQMTAITFPKTP